MKNKELINEKLIILLRIRYICGEDGGRFRITTNSLNVFKLNGIIMLAYKYETRITKTGQINLPLNNILYDKEVEIIIVPKQEAKTSKLNPSDFIQKWSGFLSNAKTDELKYEYLTEKYK